MIVEELTQALLSAGSDGERLQLIANARTQEPDNDKQIPAALAALHNEGRIDLLKIFNGLSVKQASGHNFFETRSVFEEALPMLSAPIGEVMRCVLHLCQAAGQDLAAGTPMHAYIKYCSKDAGIAREALELIEANFEILGDILPATARAGSQFDPHYFLKALIRLLQDGDSEIRGRAAFAIGGLHLSNDLTGSDMALIALEELVATEGDDKVLASAIKASLELFLANAALEARCSSLIDRALSGGNEMCLHAASEVFWLRLGELPAQVIQHFLAHLKKVRAENKSTIHNIDRGVAHLLERLKSLEGLDLIEAILIANPEAIDPDQFDCVTAAIASDASLLCKVATRWLLKGDPVLCRAVHHFVARLDGRPQIAIDPSELVRREHRHILFIARKAIGYLFTTPITATSVLISLMQFAEKDETFQALGELLFDPLLLNYTGGTREFMQEVSVGEAGKAKETILGALASIDAYLNDLRDVPDLPALQPPESHREAYRRNFSASMFEAMKTAQKKSVFFNVISRSTLLYGNKSVNYIYRGEGDSRRAEIPMQSHGVTMELPRMDVLDPHGLDHRLRFFRVERLRE
jgi:hypothetical protein